MLARNCTEPSGYTTHPNLPPNPHQPENVSRWQDVQNQQGQSEKAHRPAGVGGRWVCDVWDVIESVTILFFGFFVFRLFYFWKQDAKLPVLDRHTNQPPTQPIDWIAFFP